MGFKLWRRKKKTVPHVPYKSRIMKQPKFSEEVQMRVDLGFIKIICAGISKAPKLKPISMTAAARSAWLEAQVKRAAKANIIKRKEKALGRKFTAKEKKELMVMPAELKATRELLEQLMPMARASKITQFVGLFFEKKPNAKPERICNVFQGFLAEQKQISIAAWEFLEDWFSKK